MTDAVLWQPARPMAHAGKYRLALGAEQIGKFLARHFDELIRRKSGEVWRPSAAKIGRELHETFGCTPWEHGRAK